MLMAASCPDFPVHNLFFLSGFSVFLKATIPPPLQLHPPSLLLNSKIRFRACPRLSLTLYLATQSVGMGGAGDEGEGEHWLVTASGSGCNYKHCITSKWVSLLSPIPGNTAAGYLTHVHALLRRSAKQPTRNRNTKS